MWGFSGVSLAILFLSVVHSSFELDPFSGRNGLQHMRWSNFWGDGGGKERRASVSGAGGGGTLGLFPFPRVGRAYHPHSIGRELGSMAMKRQGLIPFPRVGRSRLENLGAAPPNAYSDPSLSQDNSNYNTNDDHWKRASDANGGMWFGPRLGKRDTSPNMVLRDRDQFDPTLALPYAMYAEFLTSKDFTPRLGREQDDNETVFDQQSESEN